VTFTDINAGLPGAFESGSCFADFDGDDLLDIVTTGQHTRLYHNNGNGTFTFLQTGGPGGLPGGGEPALGWGDYNNDGLVDLLIDAKLYRNNGNGTFSSIQAGLEAINGGSVAWGDYDNDGFQDIAMCGVGAAETITRVYRNNHDGTFTDINAGLPGVFEGGVAWGDYDNDGRLDLLMMGKLHVFSSDTKIARIYHNNGNDTFTDIAAGLPGGYEVNGAWGDYDNDGWLDILVCGIDGIGLSDVHSAVYHNNGNGTFTDIGFRSQVLAAGSGAWGDYDNDGLLDILLTGGGLGDETFALVYHNDGGGVFSDIGACRESGRVGSLGRL